MTNSPTHPMVIAVAGAKGGLAKTTTAVYLAAVAATDGRTVLVLDGDSQASAVEWLAAIDLPGVDAEPITSAGWSSVTDRAAGYDVVLIDLPPGDLDVIAAGCSVAGLVVTPCGPLPAEQAKLGDVIRLAASVGRQAVILATRVRGGTRSGLDLVDRLDALSLLRFEAAIPMRESIGQSYGAPLSAEGLEAYGPVWSELVEAWTDLAVEVV